MKKHKMIVSLALALTLLCGTAFAADAIKTQMIEANYMGIRVVIDGLEVTPTDATGHTVEPFTSNGTTYLPVRAVAEALGKDVEWDGENRIVYIGDNIPGKDINWMTKLPPYQINNGYFYEGTDHESYFNVAGKKQTQGIVLQASGRYFNYGGAWSEAEYPRDRVNDRNYNYTATALWNTNGQYKTMNITIGHMGTEQLDCRLEVYLDSVYSQTIDLPWDGAPKTIAIPLNYAPNVKIELITPDFGYQDGTVATQYGFYDISFVE